MSLVQLIACRYGLQLSIADICKAPIMAAFNASLLVSCIRLKGMHYHSKGNDLELKAWADHGESSKLYRKYHHPNMMVLVLEERAF